VYGITTKEDKYKKFTCVNSLVGEFAAFKKRIFKK